MKIKSLSNLILVTLFSLGIAGCAANKIHKKERVEPSGEWHSQFSISDTTEACRADELLTFRWLFNMRYESGVSPDTLRKGWIKGDVKEDPTIENLMQEGYLQFLQQNYDSALTLYSEALNLSPSRVVKVVICAEMGRVHEARGNLKKAEAFYEKAIENNRIGNRNRIAVSGGGATELWSPLYLFGRSREKKGEIEKAIECYLEEITRSENSSGIITTCPAAEAILLQKIGECYDKLGNSDKALEYLLKAQEREKEGPQLRIGY